MKTHVARPSLAKQHEAAAAEAKAPQAPKAPALDPEVASFPSATVWLNRAAPDPTPPAARLKLSFARELVRYSRAAHVDWALVLATLRAEGHNDRVPASASGLRTLAFKLSGFGGRANAWAAALAYSSDTSLADRVVALRHYYRAVGLASLVDGLLSQKADLQDRVLHDQRLHDLPGRAAGRRQGPRGRPRARADALPGRDLPPGDGLVPDQRPPPVRAAGRRLGAHLRARRRHRGPARDLDLRAPGSPAGSRSRPSAAS